MNEIHIHVKTGTVGELLVALRLLQFGVQAAPPIKDSGNDLIAVRGPQFRAVQVKTRRGATVQLNNLPHFYHIIALVHLVGPEDAFNLEETRIYLLSREQVEALPNQTVHFANLGEYEMSHNVVDYLFDFEHGEAVVHFNGEEE